MFLWVGLQSDNTRPASRVGLKSDPQGRQAMFLWVGLQSDNITCSASRVGLKSDPQGRQAVFPQPIRLFTDWTPE